MKRKLLFALVIVLACSCAKKTYDNPDYSYYKREISKLKRVENAKLQKDEPKPVKSPVAKVKAPSYLTAKEKERYAELLQVPLDSIKNEKLYAAIDRWMGTPYQWGGTSRKGVDCSSLTQKIYHEVYGEEIPRTSLQQFYYDTEAQFQSQKYLKEGDLVFFRLRYEDEVVSHVGIYLQNGKFIGSNSPYGVQITNFDTNYWQDKYVACARLLKN